MYKSSSDMFAACRNSQAERIAEKEYVLSLISASCAKLRKVGKTAKLQTSMLPVSPGPHFSMPLQMFTTA